MLASAITKRAEPAGKILKLGKHNCVVENHPATHCSVLFHHTDELCNSTHTHKIAIDVCELKKDKPAVFDNM